MRRITYGGGVFLTGDDIASALLGYAHALSETKSADTVMVPGMTAESVEGHIEVLIGPASQLMSEPAPEEGEAVDELVDDIFVADMHERGSQKRAVRMAAVNAADSVDPLTSVKSADPSWIDDM